MPASEHIYEFKCFSQLVQVQTMAFTVSWDNWQGSSVEEVLHFGFFRKLANVLIQNVHMATISC